MIYGMKENFEYVLVSNSDRQKFVEEVNEALSKGLKCKGEITTGEKNGFLIWGQVMVKKA